MASATSAVTLDIGAGMQLATGQAAAVGTSPAPMIAAQDTLLDHMMHRSALRPAPNTRTQATGNEIAPATGEDSQVRHASSSNAATAILATDAASRTMPSDKANRSFKSAFQTTAGMSETPDLNAKTNANLTLDEATTLSTPAAPLAKRILTAETVTGIFAVESKLL